MSRKILLADDSLTIQKVVELTFMEGDYEVTATSNGDEALARLSDMDPDVVIADVHMPGADGFEICRASKSQYPDIPVLLLVGTFEPFEESAANDAGADAHLKKPFDSQELMKLVESLIGNGPEIEPLDEDASFGSMDDSSSTEVAAGDSEELDDSLEPISLSEASATEIIENFDQIPPLETEEMGDSGIGFEPSADNIVPSVQALSENDVERIARRVVELIGDQVVREISWDVIPDLAEIVIKDRIKELESQFD